MIRYILLTGILMALFLTSNGQRNSIQYGLHGGINFNSETGSSISKHVKSIVPGFGMGGHIKINTTTHFGIKAILQYERNGWGYRSLTFENSTGTGLANGKVTYKLNYLNLPVLAEYTLGNKIKFYADAGPFVGILLNNQMITKLEDPSASNQATTITSKSDFLERINYGITIGVGTQIPVTTKLKLDFDLRNTSGWQTLANSRTHLAPLKQIPF